MHAAFFKQAAEETEKRQQLALCHSASWCRRHLDAHACLLIARPCKVRTNRKRWDGWYPWYLLTQVSPKCGVHNFTNWISTPVKLSCFPCGIKQHSLHSYSGSSWNKRELCCDLSVSRISKFPVKWSLEPHFPLGLSGLLLALAMKRHKLDSPNQTWARLPSQEQAVLPPPLPAALVKPLTLMPCSQHACMHRKTRKSPAMRSAVISQRSQDAEAKENILPLKKQVNSQEFYNTVLIIASIHLLLPFLLC